MKKVILFTSNQSILKHWTNALSGLYNRVHIQNYAELESFLKVNTSANTLMVDELNVGSIHTFLGNLEIYPQTTILVFNSVPNVHHASMVIGKNVKGYENSYLNKINLLNMLDSVHNGKKWLFPELTNYIINKFIQDSSSKEPEFIVRLTEKEKEIAYMVADGLTNKEIVQSEGIALSTVKNHLNKIFEKAGVSDRVSLALKFR
ncbi:MAG: response regulator transcription factor [Helicobacteraceae bacterium]|nr:response regulator transcription factor [Candidatus Sulfurimonas ponti]